MHSCQLLGFGVLTVGETSKVTSAGTKGSVTKFNNQLSPPIVQKKKKTVGKISRKGVEERYTLAGCLIHLTL